ncbi:MAG: HlyD family secretion protein [Candidatus Methylomirabilales bacterium]
MAPPRTPVWIGAALLLAGALAAWLLWGHRRAPEDVLRASGRIEVTEVSVASKVTGRIAELPVQEGTDVAAGQRIARLEGEELQAQLRQARAALQSAEARVAQARITLRTEPTRVSSQIRQAEETVRAADERLRMLRTGSREQEIEEGRANLRQAEARLELARVTHARFRELAGEGAVARQELDRAASDYQAAEAAVKAARERLALLVEGPRREDIRAAEAERDRALAALEAARANASSLDLRRQDVQVAEATVREAEAAVRRLETQVAELEILSPLAGTVLTKVAEPGEVVASGRTVVILGDLDRPWIKIYVPEAALGKVQLGAAARIYVDSFPDRPFHGTVTWIADQAEFTPKNVQTQEERVNLVYAVKITIRDAERRLKAGMPADAEVTLTPASRG